jgi:transposase
MEVIDTGADEVVQRIAALDIGKAELTCCVRLPAPDGKRGRRQEVKEWRTTTRSLMRLADELAALGVTKVVMESTSDYWKPPFYVMEAAGFEVELLNARDVKHLPGRPKTDRLDAVWLCKVAERGMARPGFVPPPELRPLRDLTRYRLDVVRVRSAEKQRVEKLLEDAQIKLSAAVSDIFGVSGRAMLQALIDGRRDPRALAELAVGSLRGRRPDLVEALTGRFTDNHGFLLAKMLARIDAAATDIAEVEARIEEHLAPFADAVDRLDAIPGIGRTGAAAIIGEIGLDMGRFPTPGHLASWAGFAPRAKQSAGRPRGRQAASHRNSYLGAVLGLAAFSASNTRCFLGSRYHRIARRRGKQRANVAVARSMLVIVWHLLNDPDATYQELGPDHFNTRASTNRQLRNHVKQLEALGYRVTLEPAA